MSAAKRLGLWTPDHSDIHVAVPRTASRLDTTGLRTHTATAPIPLARSVTEEPILNVLFHTARCAPPADALAVWESALKHRLVEPALLQRVRWRSTRAAAFARVASDLSDSGVETRFLILMRSVGMRVRQQVWIDGHPLDGLIGERLAIQIDGFAHHSSARDRRRDLRADGRLALRGYTVLRFDYYQVLFDPTQVIETVLTAIAQGLHRPGRR